MSFSVTALQLVNRTRRKRRQGDTTALSSHEDLAALDAVNQAIDLVTNTREWQFDVRHDQFTTKARISSVQVDYTAIAGNRSLVVTKSGLLDRDVYSPTSNNYADFIMRVMPKGDSTYGNTALRALFSTAVATDLSVVRIPYPLGSAISTTTGEMFYSEYLLPDTVKSIHRVRYQDNTLTLDQLDPTIEFDELFPRPQVEYGEPRIVSVGGYDHQTYMSNTDQPAPKLRMIVWPVPDDEYVLDYQYVYRHPELTAATDTLEGVPPEVVDQIVDLATADMMAWFDRRVDDARSLRGDTYQIMDEIHDRHGGQTSDRAVVRNWESVGGSPHDRYSITRGRLIGG